MDSESRERLRTELSVLRSGSGSISPAEAESKISSVLKELLADAGYEVEHTGRFDADDGGIDFVVSQRSSQNKDNRIAIEFKYGNKNRGVGLAEIRKLIGAATMANIGRSLLLTNKKISSAARQAAERSLPIEIELADLDTLEAWVERLKIVEDTSLAEEVQLILAETSGRFAKMIAKNPNVLDELEWRDIERVMAEVFAGIGFSVELTPGSKDGGKDIVLQCTVKGKRRDYIVELKHWRSQQRVGGGHLRNFLKVIVKEQRNAGLFLSTYGYCDNAFEQLSEIERKKLRFGDQSKIIGLCQTYTRTTTGLLQSESLPEVLFESTV